MSIKTRIRRKKLLQDLMLITESYRTSVRGLGAEDILDVLKDVEAYYTAQVEKARDKMYDSRGIRAVDAVILNKMRGASYHGG